MCGNCTVFYYACSNSIIDDAKHVAANHNISDLSVHQPNSPDIAMYYSFEFAQQIHYPSDPLQPAPMYF